MKTLLTIVIVHLFVTTTTAQTGQQHEKWVLIETENLPSSGLLLKHHNAATAVLIVAGSGPTDHNGNIAANGMINNSYKMLANALYSAGYSVLRYDKKGIGKSAHKDFNMSKTLFKDYVNDVVKWVEYLSTNHQNVVVVGHSLGGLMAIQAANKSTVSKLVTLAGVADSGYQTVRRQMRDQPEFVRDAAIPLLDRLAQGETIPQEEVPVFLNALFSPAIQPYMKSFMMIDPRKELSLLNIPVLNIIGDNDLQIQVTETQSLSEGLDHAQTLVITGMNHVLKPAPKDRNQNLATYSQPDLPLHNELMPAILKFIKQ